MNYNRFLFAAITLISFFSLSCKETIINNIPSGGSLSNDQFHGDIVGRVFQKESNAVVLINQVSVIDSTRINSSDGSFAFRNIRLGNYDLTIRADNYRIYKRANVIVSGGGIAYVGDIDLSKVPDLVADHYPKNNGEVVYDNRFARLSISILFTQPMDRVSVEKAFSTDPPSTGIFYWGQYIYSPIYAFYPRVDAATPVDVGAEITTFSKVTSVTYAMSRKDSYVDTTYTVTLSTEAHDTSGNHLRFPLVFKFSTVQASYTVYGIQTDPVDGDIDVSPLTYGGIRVTFPRRMDPVTTEAALSVTPNDSRIVLWPQGNVMTIYMGGIFRADTLYQVTIDSTARDLDGNLLGERFSFSFRTAPVHISWTGPGNGQLFVNPSTRISLYFNTYILKSTVESSFSISPNVAGTFVYGGLYQDVKYIVEFIPSTSLQRNTKYTVSINPAVKDMFGTFMKKSHTFSFVTSPE
ncbi:MAG: Ig-like domain-containing protein [Ignavibacteriae bacterium]|nr:Ig-like domain-containing protein [Ignavibacteriota bacterium]